MRSYRYSVLITNPDDVDYCRVVAVGLTIQSAHKVEQQTLRHLRDGYEVRVVEETPA